MGFKLNKSQIKILEEYVNEVHDLIETLATDPETEHLVGENIEDCHFQVRYIVEELVKSVNGDGE